MFQFSLRNLLIAVAGCAFGAAALVNANAWWVAITWSAALFSVTAAALLAMHRREEKRAFWGGFTFFGSLYLLLLMYSIQPVSSSNSSVLCLEPLSYHNLLTTKLTTWTYSRLPAALVTEYLPVAGLGPMGSGGPPGGMPGMGSSGSVPASGPAGLTFPDPNPRYVNQYRYTDVGHALWTLLIASLGGALSCWFFKTRQRPAP